MRLLIRLLVLMVLPAVLAPAVYARDINWSKTDSTGITLFYPGVASWEFLTSDDHRLGSREIKKTKKECRYCHLSKEGELDLKADEIASGSIRMKRSHKPYEPEPVAGRKGALLAKIQAAYDKEFLYLRVEWQSKGTGWQTKKTSESIPDRVSIQANKAEVSFKKYGCFIACHNDINTMPESPSKKEVSSVPYFSKLGRDDARLYAFYAKNSWSHRKSQQELEKSLKEGGRIDVWSIELQDSSATPLQGWIFDDRIWKDKAEFEGAGSWASGRYTAFYKIRIKPSDPYDVHMTDGDVIYTGLAIHDDGVVKRKHYVSFPFSIGLGVDADVKAQRLPD